MPKTGPSPEKFTPEDKMISPETAERYQELRGSKEDKKKILYKLAFLIEHDKQAEDTLYIDRSREVEKSLASQIQEIKEIAFDRAINVHLRCEFAESLLSHLPGAKEIVRQLHTKNERKEEIIGRHSERYDVDLESKKQDFHHENNRIFTELDEAISQQEEVVETLQDLLVEDQDFSETYLHNLNRASRKLSVKEHERKVLVLTKAEEVLAGAQESEKYLKQIRELRDKLDQIDQTGRALTSEQIDWEILPPGEQDKPIGITREKTGEEWEYLKDEDRIAYIETLGPEKTYESMNPDIHRSYQAYEFPNHMVLASVWADHAVYVVPKDNWRDIKGKDKQELRFRGAVQLKRTKNWQNRLELILSGEVKVNVDFDIPFEPKKTHAWGPNPENWKRIIRQEVFAQHPEIELGIQIGDEASLKEAKQIAKGILTKQMVEMGISHGEWKLGGHAKAMIECFPELGLTPKDYPRPKRYKWKNVDQKQRIQNVRTAIFENLSDVRHALEEGRFDEAAEWLAMLKHDEFKVFGLKYVSDGKVPSLGSIRSALLASFPEIPNLDKVLLKHASRGKSKEENAERWGLIYRDVLTRETPGLSAAVEDNDLEQAKYLILQKLKEFGATKFVSTYIPSLRGLTGIRTRQVDFLALAFPEIDWEA